MRPLLLTGATGVVGRALLPRLLRAGWKVRVLTRKPLSAGDPYPGDIRDSSALGRALRGVWGVVHLAALVDYGHSPRDLVWDVNWAATRLLLREARNAGVNYFLYVSSVAALTPKRVKTPYALSKARALAEALRSPLRVGVLVPGVVVGPGSQLERSRPWVWPRSDSPTFLVHLYDLCSAAMLLLEGAQKGVFLCGLSVPLFSLAKSIPGSPTLAPPWLFKMSASLGAFLVSLGFRVPFTPEAVKMLLCQWDYSSDRLRALGWAPKATQAWLGANER